VSPANSIILAIKMLEFLEKLRTDAWRTAGARYNAARRLKRRDLFATLSLSLFAACGVGLAVVQRIYSFEPGSPTDNYLTALSICLGIFLLVISLIEWGAGNSVKADRLHQNAEELNTFQRKLGLAILDLKAGNSVSSQKVTEYLQQYEDIKAKSPFNHDPIDDHLFVATHRFADEFKTSNGKPLYFAIEQRWLALKSICSSIWYFIAFWLVIFQLILITPWCKTTKLKSAYEVSQSQNLPIISSRQGCLIDNICKQTTDATVD
jgi:hypothetical protein